MENVLSSTAIGDIAVVGILLAVFIAYSLWRGTAALIVAIVSLPIAGFLFNSFPYHAQLSTWVPQSMVVYAPFVVFAVLWLSSAWILRRTVGGGLGSSRPLHIAVVSVTLTAFVILFLYHVVPIESVYDFGPFLDSVFSSYAHVFWVAVIGLIALFVV